MTDTRDEQQNRHDPAGIEAEVDAHAKTPEEVEQERAASAPANVRPLRAGNGGGGGTTGGTTTTVSPSRHRTHYGNALRLIDAHGENLHYCYERNQWLYYCSTHWVWDTKGEVERRAKDVINVILAEAQNAIDNEERTKLIKWALTTESVPQLKAMVEAAKSEPGIAVEMSDFDKDNLLINCANGTFDVRTGSLREHRRDDLISRLIPIEYDPDADAPIFEAFLIRILPDPEIRGWIQEYYGYALTGDTRERVLAMFHGNQGKNGKSTLVETLRKGAGGNEGYALTVAPETIMAKPTGGVPNDVARLSGARLVSVSETEKSRRLAEGLIKQMTGGEDTMSARFMRSEWFDFSPTHKIFLSTNHRPVIKGTDEAIWDRVRLVPFEERIPKHEQDKALPRKLEVELPGILAWGLEGCARWYRQGLSEPSAIMAATDEYRKEMDVLGDFLADRCVIHSNAEIGSSALYEAYKEWCMETGEDSITHKAFGTELKERGFDNSTRFTAGPDRGKAKWKGIGLLSPEDDHGGGRRNSEGLPSESAVSEGSIVDSNSEQAYNAQDSDQNEGSTLHSELVPSPILHSENSVSQSGKSPCNTGESEGCDLFLDINSSESKPRVVMSKYPSHPSHPSQGGSERADLAPENQVLESSSEPSDNASTDDIMARAKALQERYLRERMGETETEETP